MLGYKPRRPQDPNSRIYRVLEFLEQKWQKGVTTEELADVLNIQEWEVVNVIASLKAYGYTIDSKRLGMRYTLKG